MGAKNGDAEPKAFEATTHLPAPPRDGVERDSSNPSQTGLDTLAPPVVHHDSEEGASSRHSSTTAVSETANEKGGKTKAERDHPITANGKVILTDDDCYEELGFCRSPVKKWAVLRCGLHRL